MAEEIYIYADSFDKKSIENTGELVNLVKKSGINLPITIFTISSADESQKYQWDTVSVLSIVSEVQAYEDDVQSRMLAHVLMQKRPRYILIPATPKVRSIFARVAALAKIGMSADCTELFVKESELIAKKPAFGNFTMVTIHNAGDMGIYSMVTGRIPPAPSGNAKAAETIHVPSYESHIQLVKWEDEKANAVINAEHVISVGKGVSSPEIMNDIWALADKLNMAVGGTRPLVDNGMLPFEAQIGQTGFTIHPKSCLFLGVSGALQHTEGVRDTQIMIAVNTDASAPIFHFADYGVVADAKDIVKAMLAITEACHDE